MNFVQKIIESIEGFFKSDKAKAALQQAASLIPVAAPIVQEIAALTPNRTVQEINAAYQKYGVPVSQQISSASSSTDIENTLLNLASAVLAKNLPSGVGTVATNILNTAVQLAVTGVKA